MEIFMKRITQVSIVYMVAALLLAQPVAQGCSFTVKSCPLHCVEVVCGAAALTLVAYSLWKLSNIKHSDAFLKEEYANDVPANENNRANWRPQWQKKC